MATIWKPTNNTETNSTFSGTLLSSWSRQQKMAMIASFVILGLLLAVSACSKQSPKPALVGVSSLPSASAPLSITNLAGISAIPAANSSSEGPTAQAKAKTASARIKKAPKKRPTDVTYSDPSSGVSFMYPRKFALASGDKAQEMDAVPMNFVRPGGVPVAMVALPGTLYPGTDFATGFFSVNLNRSLSEQECPHFAFVDTSDADGEPIDAEKVKVGLPNGLKEMEMTSEFEGNSTRQLETQYYHNYENGACYEYVLGLGTAGYGAKEGVEPVNRDDVFARLKKILSTVKTRPVTEEPVTHQPTAEQTVAAADSTK
jgi:hypothetical protein